jgi:hypothetical protein
VSLAAYDPPVPPAFTQCWIRTRPVYKAALAARPASGSEAIAVEDIRAPLLMLSGSDDQMWPSAVMEDPVSMRAGGLGSSTSSIGTPVTNS